jgi:hypothetical protein
MISGSWYSARWFGVAYSMVFLDESGHFSSSDYLCMAGYMATPDGWDALCPGWQYLLREKYKIPALHMREIMSNAGKRRDAFTRQTAKWCAPNQSLRPAEAAWRAAIRAAR